MPSAGGEVVSETLPFDGGRRVTAYLPVAAPEVIVFAGDGQLLAPWGAVLEAADVPPTVLVATDRTHDEERRLHEYSPAFDPGCFAAHEAFFVEEASAWARTRLGVDLPRERTAVFGVSAGAELALAVGLRHPDRYGAVLGASPGAGFRPSGRLSEVLPRAYLVAGTEEPFFRDNAARWAEAFAAAGADVVMVERPGGHGGAFWRDELPAMVAWLVG